MTSFDFEDDLQFRKIIFSHLLNAVRRSYRKELHTDPALLKRVERELRKVLKFLSGSHSQHRRRGRKARYSSQAFRAYRSVELKDRTRFFNSWIGGFAQMSSEQRKRAIRNFRSAYVYWTKKQAANKFKMVATA